MGATLGLASGAWAVLFTDVSGSTALRVRLGDDQADMVYGEHDGLVRATIDAAGGLVVKTTGDGLMAAFRSSAEAIAAAVRIQQAVVAADQRQEVGLKVRVGISMGDVALQGGDLQGIPVVEAARLCDRAEPGEVLVSETARLVAGTRGGHEFCPTWPPGAQGIGRAGQRLCRAVEPDRRRGHPTIHVSEPRFAQGWSSESAHDVRRPWRRGR